MRPIRIALLALVTLFAAAPLRAQAPAGETATGAAAAAAEGSPTSTAAPAPADAPAASGAAPASYTPPRTLRAYAHVFVAFAVAWVLLFGYVFFLARRFRRVEEQVEALARS